MKYDKHLAEVAVYFDEMDICDDSPLQFDYDEDTRTLRIHVLTEDELETLAETECERCVHANTCRDAHKITGPCDAFIDKEEAW